MGIKWCRLSSPSTSCHVAGLGVPRTALIVRCHHSAFSRTNPSTSSCGSLCIFSPLKSHTWVLNSSQNTPSPPRFCPSVNEQSTHCLPVPGVLGRRGTEQRRAASNQALRHLAWKAANLEPGEREPGPGRPFWLQESQAQSGQCLQHLRSQVRAHEHIPPRFLPNPSCQGAGGKGAGMLERS